MFEQQKIKMSVVSPDARLITKRIHYLFVASAESLRFAPAIVSSVYVVNVVIVSFIPRAGQSSR